MHKNLLFFKIIFRWIFGKIGCFFEGAVAYIIGTASIYILALVAGDRQAYFCFNFLFERFN
jgi:hypothetical protein